MTAAGANHGGERANTCRRWASNRLGSLPLETVEFEMATARKRGRKSAESLAIIEAPAPIERGSKPGGLDRFLLREPPPAPLGSRR